MRAGDEENPHGTLSVDRLTAASMRPASHAVMGVEPLHWPRLDLIWYAPRSRSNRTYVVRRRRPCVQRPSSGTYLSVARYATGSGSRCAPPTHRVCGDRPPRHATQAMFGDIRSAICSITPTCRASPSCRPRSARGWTSGSRRASRRMYDAADTAGTSISSRPTWSCSSIGPTTPGPCTTRFRPFAIGCARRVRTRRDNAEIIAESLQHLPMYILYGWETGIYNEFRHLRYRGLSKAQLMELVLFAQLQAGMRGLQLVYNGASRLLRGSAGRRARRRRSPRAGRPTQRPSRLGWTFHARRSPTPIARIEGLVRAHDRLRAELRQVRAASTTPSSTSGIAPAGR